MSGFMVFSLLCVAVIMLSVALARPERPFRRHHPHHQESQNSEEPSIESRQFHGPLDDNHRFPCDHHRPEFRQHPHGGHGHHEFGNMFHHGFGPEHNHDHGFGPGYNHDHAFGPEHNHAFGPEHNHAFEPEHNHAFGPGHNHGFGPEHNHNHGFRPIHMHGLGPIHHPDYGFDFNHGHDHHNNNHHHNGGNLNSDNFNFIYHFDPNRHNLPFDFSHYNFDFVENVAPNFNISPNGPFPFPGTQMTIPFVPPANNFPNIFNNPFANWPMINNVNNNIPSQQPTFNGFDINGLPTTTIPALDPASILENDDSNNHQNGTNEMTTESTTINSNANTNDGNGDAANTNGWPNANEFFNRIPSETNSNDGFDQLGGNDGGGGGGGVGVGVGDDDAVINNKNPDFIATTTSFPIPYPSVTPNIDQAVTAVIPHEQANTDYIGLIDVRFGEDMQNKTINGTRES